jgi:uncharacterized coiled-coil DUF342 family protein
MEMFKNLEQAVSNLNHELVRQKKEHKAEKVELYRQIDEYKDKEKNYKDQIKMFQARVEEQSKIIDKYKVIVKDMEG